jgi:hypothetical protein
VSSKTDIALAMNEIEIFVSFSGLILNRNKTEGIWIGTIFTFIPLIFLFSLSLNAIISTEITNKRADKGHP